MFRERFIGGKRGLCPPLPDDPDESLNGAEHHGMPLKIRGCPTESTP